MAGYLSIITRTQMNGELILVVGALISLPHNLARYVWQKVKQWLGPAWEEWTKKVERRLWWLGLLIILVSLPGRGEPPARDDRSMNDLCGNFTPEIWHAVVYQSNTAPVSSMYGPMRHAERNFLPIYLELYTLKTDMWNTIASLHDDSFPAWIEAREHHSPDAKSVGSDIDKAIFELSYNQSRCHGFQTQLPVFAAQLEDRVEYAYNQVRLERDFRLATAVGRLFYSERAAFAVEMNETSLEEAVGRLEEAGRGMQVIQSGLEVAHDLCMDGAVGSLQSVWNDMKSKMGTAQLGDAQAVAEEGRDQWGLDSCNG